METKDPIADKLGIAPMAKPSVNTDLVVANSTAVATVTPAQRAEHQLADYELSRKNLHRLLQQGMEAVDLMMNITDQSQHPRSAEVLAALLKNVADINDKLMILQEKIMKLQNEVAPAAAPIHIGSIDKAVFTGTTRELLHQMRETQEE